MSERTEIDLEVEKALVDGAWFSRDELWERMNASIAGKDYKSISRLAAILEQLDQAIAGARTVTVKLSAEHFAKLEAAGEKLGKSASVFAREVLVQVLGGATGPSAPKTEPVAKAEPLPLPKAEPVAVEPPPVVAPSDEGALTLQPKRRDPPVIAGPGQAPPVMTPVASVQAPPPVMAPAGPGPSVVVDLESEDDKPKPAGDGRRWFNRT